MRLNYFNFKKFDDKVLLTNDFGCHLFVSPADFVSILNKEIDIESDLGRKLIERQMVYNETSLEYSSRLKHDIRRMKGHVNVATSLHIFVVTTACNVECVYCQAKSGTSCQPVFMTKETAEKAVDIALQSPAKCLNFEFQGGEPLLNFEIIKHIVEYAETKKGQHEITYNVVTNLTLLTDEILDYFVENHFGVSTSIDGPAVVHDKNRPFKSGEGTYEKAVSSIKRVQERGIRVGAIQTTTRDSLRFPREIVRAYKDLGFESIFIRPLTPLGKAAANWATIGYTPEEYILFYQEVIDELMQINKNERYMREDHSSILLNRIDGKFVNYMELRSPCGASIGQLAYYADGNIFTCDEGRMLHEMGDHTFKLGNVYHNSYAEIINNGVCRTVCASSILETIPTCCDCVYQPYCGTCPVVNYAKSKDVIEKEPRGYRCKIYSGMLDYLFRLIMSEEATTLDILRTWSN